MRLLGALVAQDEANVGLVGGHRGDTGVHIHVIINGDVVVALGGQGHIALTEHRVEEAVVVAAIVIVLFNDEVSRVDAVHPGGNFLIIFALAGDGVDQHRTVNVGAAEQADGLDGARTDPVGCTFIVNLKYRRRKHHGGVAEPQQTVEVAAEMLSGRVFHALVKAHDFGFLRYHVNDEVGGQTVGAVGEPLDRVPIAQRGDAHGAVLVVNLTVSGQNLELADHVAQFAELAAA